MSYSDQDTRNLEACNILFGADMRAVGDAGATLFHVPIRNFFYNPDATTVLTAGLASTTHSDQDIYSWIDVQNYYMPDIVSDVLKRCADANLRLVITHDEKCSHGPGKRFPLSFMRLLSAASSSAETWHPVLEEMVPSMRNWVLPVASLPEHHTLFSDPRAVAGYYHAVAEVIRLEGAGFTVDRLLLRMGGVEIARVAADQEDLLVFTRNGIF